MGCDIHPHVEVRVGDRWEKAKGIMFGEYNDAPFDNRSYAVFGWLAGPRNYSEVGPFMEPRGFPDDASDDVRAHFEDWGVAAHTPSWVTLTELLVVDYDAEVNDRRVTRQVGRNAWNGGCTGGPEEGRLRPLREFLGTSFMRDLEILRMLEAEVRVVFWFDN
jgi:hypothetical protein